MVKRNMRCPCCGREVEANWTYCPYCGCMLGFRTFEDFFEFEREYIRDFFEDFDRLVRKTFKELLKPFDIEKEPYVRGGGISIVIKSESGKKPKVYVKTFGDYKDLEPKIKEDIKKRIGIEEIEEEKPEKVKEVREVKVTEEPEVKIKRDLHRIEIEVDLPDVESAKDIEISELEESIEIRAYAKDKAYFKIISKPKNKSIVEKKFEKGKLKIILE
ncbi:MAG: zinc ribbon domain-containing protein [Candidatus Aenigmatarchaeota archaeon]